MKTKIDYTGKVIDLLWEANLLWFTLGDLISADTVYNIETAEESLKILNQIYENLKDTEEIPEEELEKIRKHVDEGISIVKIDKQRFETYKN